MLLETAKFKKFLESLIAIKYNEFVIAFDGYKVNVKSLNDDSIYVDATLFVPCTEDKIAVNNIDLIIKFLGKSESVNITKQLDRVHFGVGDKSLNLYERNEKLMVNSFTAITDSNKKRHDTIVNLIDMNDVNNFTLDSSELTAISTWFKNTKSKLSNKELNSLRVISTGDKITFLVEESNSFNSDISFVKIAQTFDLNVRFEFIDLITQFDMVTIGVKDHFVVKYQDDDLDVKYLITSNL